MCHGECDSPVLIAVGKTGPEVGSQARGTRPGSACPDLDWRGQRAAQPPQRGAGKAEAPQASCVWPRWPRLARTAESWRR